MNPDRSAAAFIRVPRAKSSADCVHPCSITTSARSSRLAGHDAGRNSTKSRAPAAVVYVVRVVSGICEEGARAAAQPGTLAITTSDSTNFKK